MRQKPRWRGVGGSDAAAILGMNKWSSPFDVWYTKTHRLSGGVDNQYTHWGNLQEPIIANHYAKKHGVFLRTSRRLWSDTIEWMSGTPDRLVFKDRDSWIPYKGLEIKTATSTQKNKWSKYGTVEDYMSIGERVSIPITYFVQCQWYMELTGVKPWDLVVKLDSADYREFTVKYDQDFMQQAIRTVDEFWHCYIKPCKPPPLDWGDGCREWVSNLFAAHDSVMIEYPPLEDGLRTWKERSETLGKVRSLREEIKEKQRELDRETELLNAQSRYLDSLKNQYRMRIGSGLGLVSEGGSVKWKGTESGRRIMRFSFTTSKS